MSKFVTLINFISKANKKTGPCGSVQIGKSREETFSSCKCAACPLLPTINVKKEDGSIKPLKGNYIKKSNRKKEGKKNRISDSFGNLKSCWAHTGLAATAAQSLNKAFAKNPNKYSIKEMFNNMTWNMRFVRIATIGDPCKADPTDLDEIRNLAEERDKKAFGYTHGFDREGMEKQADLLRASCMSIERVKEAFKKGFTASLVIPHKKGQKLQRIMKIDDIEGRVCDYYSDEFLQGQKNIQRTDCNSCLKCDPNSGIRLIIFPSHN